ncbi:MAG: mannose-6-phosphate isomerase, class I [Pseudomonadota bacterium]
MKASAFPLRGKVRHYAWGGDAYIPDLLGQPEGDQPWAEYWLGAHPGDPAEVLIEGRWQSLAKLIKDDRAHWLGQPTANRFDELPYLMKVLDVARPLSIQVHPNAAQAVEGFTRENALGIAKDSPQRNFKDANPKPELALALSSFWLLYGFRPLADGLEQLRRFPSLKQPGRLLETEGLQALFERLMRAPADELAAWLAPVLETAGSHTAGISSDPISWLSRWRSLHATPGDAVDRGVFGFLLMNLVKLEPGETIFQDANVPHAYLHGQCAEIMANSDNVLRGGLTPKHVDVEALISHIEFVPASERQDLPPMSLKEFSLVRLRGNNARSITGPACGLVLDGQATVGEFTARRGEGFFVRGGQRIIPDISSRGDVLVGSPALSLLET